MARLDPGEAEDYSVVKFSLLRKFRLSPEAFRIKFLQTIKECKESYSEFAYRLKGFFESWLRGANAFEDREKILEQFALEQFFCSIPSTLKEWIQDRPEVETIQKAADYADQYCSRRREVTDDKPAFARNQSRKSDHSCSRKYEPTTGSPTPEEVEVASDDTKSKRKSFEERKPIRCYKYHQAGHVAAGCRVPKVSPVNLSLGNPEELLEPYLYNIKVNGTPCKCLRDTGATYDLVHSSLVKQSDFTSDCVWIRQALEDRSYSLPVAKVKLSGPFGVVDTDAAVSDGVLPSCPYILSNRTAKQLSESGVALNMNPVLVVTRSMKKKEAREKETVLVAAVRASTDTSTEEATAGSGMTTLVSPESQHF